MRDFIKLFSFLLVISVVSIYCFKCFDSLKSAFIKYKQLKPEYTLLLKKQEDLFLELNILKNKVEGIREKTLNKDILEERIKTMLNYKNSNEILLTN